MLPKGREVPETGREFANARQGPEARGRICRSSEGKISSVGISGNSRQPHQAAWRGD